MMTNVEIENLISAYHKREYEERNRVLRARLRRPLSSEEHLARLATLAELIAPRPEGKIELTNSSSLYIMDTAR